jgi:hypothetical protein
MPEDPIKLLSTRAERFPQPDDAQALRGPNPGTGRNDTFAET